MRPSRCGRRGHDLVGLDAARVELFVYHPNIVLLYPPGSAQGGHHGPARRRRVFYASAVRERLPDAAAKARVTAWMPPDLVDQVPLDLLGPTASSPMLDMSGTDPIEDYLDALRLMLGSVRPPTGRAFFRAFMNSNGRSGPRSDL
jgi:hypothetical protein